MEYGVLRASAWGHNASCVMGSGLVCTFAHDLGVDS